MVSQCWELLRPFVRSLSRRKPVVMSLHLHCSFFKKKMVSLSRQEKVVRRILGLVSVRLKDIPAGSETHGLLFSSHAPLEFDTHSVERCQCKVLGPKLSQTTVI